METSNQLPRRFDRLILIVIIASLLGIVLVPFGVAYWPIERARWLLAAADATLDQATDNSDDARRTAQTFLDRAGKSYPEIEKSPDFAAVSFRVNKGDFVQALKWLPVLRPSDQPRAADKLAEGLLKAKLFGEAYDLLAAYYPRSPFRSPEEQNQLAYFAALANRDLETALDEVNKALAKHVNFSFLDTKAWVLYRLKRFDDALEVIQLAVKEEEKVLRNPRFPRRYADQIDSFLEGKPPFVRRPLEDKSTPLDELHPNLAELIRTTIVTRYHRGEILEAAGQVEAADQEYEWIKNRGFNDFDRLY